VIVVGEANGEQKELCSTAIKSCGIARLLASCEWNRLRSFAEKKRGFRENRPPPRKKDWIKTRSLKKASHKGGLGAGEA